MLQNSLFSEVHWNLPSIGEQAHTGLEPGKRSKGVGVNMKARPNVDFLVSGKNSRRRFQSEGDNR